jgi:hypothetical protein
VSALTARLDLALTPFLNEPSEPGFEWSAVGVVNGCGVDSEGVADPEGFVVGLEGVTDEDGGGAALGCGNGEKLGLDFDEGHRGHGEKRLCDA